jgi:hypothetical protein
MQIKGHKFGEAAGPSFMQFMIVFSAFFPSVRNAKFAVKRQDIKPIKLRYLLTQSEIPQARKTAAFSICMEFFWWFDAKSTMEKIVFDIWMNPKIKRKNFKLFNKSKPRLGVLEMDIQHVLDGILEQS